MAVHNAVRGTKLVSITKSDSTEYDPPLEALWVGVTGDVAILAAGDSTAVTISNVPVGLALQGVQITKVMSTNTTADELIGIR